MYKAFRKTIWHAIYLVADLKCSLIPNFDHLSPDQMTHIMSCHIASGCSIKIVTECANVGLIIVKSTPTEGLMLLSIL